MTYIYSICYKLQVVLFFYLHLVYIQVHNKIYLPRKTKRPPIEMGLVLDMYMTTPMHLLPLFFHVYTCLNAINPCSNIAIQYLNSRNDVHYLWLIFFLEMFHMSSTPSVPVLCLALVPPVVNLVQQTKGSIALSPRAHGLGPHHNKQQHLTISIRTCHVI